MPDQPVTPEAQVSKSCLAFVDAIIAKHDLMDIPSARKTGHALYQWFGEHGGLSVPKAPIAAGCIDSGTTTLKSTRSQAIEDVIAQIKADFETYGAGTLTESSNQARRVKNEAK